MKKALILFLAFALVGAYAFAEGTAPVEFSISGAACIEWGIDLDAMYTGFKSYSDGLQIKAKVNYGEQKKAGEGAYGELKIGGIRLEADTGWSGAAGDYGSAAVNLKWDDVNAKIVFGDLSVNFFQSSGVKTNYQGEAGSDSYWLKNALDYEIYNGAYGSADLSNAVAHSWESWNDVYFKTPGKGLLNIGGTGINIAYAMPDVATIGIKVNSEKDWTAGHSITPATATATDKPESGGYAFQPYVELKAVPGLTFNVGAALAMGYDDKATPAATAIEDKAMSFAAKVAYDISLGEGMKVTPAVAFDYMSDVVTATGENVDNSAMGITGGIMASLDKLLNLSVNVGFKPDTTADADLTSDMALTVNADVKAIEGLTAQVAFELKDYTDAAFGTDDGMGIFFNLAYAVKADALTITPFVKGSYDTYDYTSAAPAADSGEASLFLKGGLTIDGAIQNTQLYIKWDSNDLIQAPVVAPVMATTMGQLYLGAKVSF